MIDLHPISVHFPIAFLSVYAVLQLIPPNITWRYNPLFMLNSFLLIVGSAGLLVARQLGERAAEGRLEVDPLIRTHAFWATNTTAIFGILTIIYTLLIIRKLHEAWVLSALDSVYRFIAPLTEIAFVLYKTYIVTILALAGAVCITITGALGGAIVYGPDIDPMVHFVYLTFVK